MSQQQDGFLSNPYYREYLHLLRELHTLIREGRDETEEGEALRERMDGPGNYLSPEEVASVNGFSADFYTLWETPVEAVPAGQRMPADAFRAALAARDAKQYERALNLLRQSESTVGPAVLACARASVWQAAGEPEIATLFLQRAAELDPQSAPDPSASLDAYV